jgi:hypothetical protein
VKITLPLPPNLANSRFHWRVKNNKRKAYFETCDILAAVRGFVKEFAAPMPERVKIKATIYCGGRMDHDNAIARLKWPVDWMVNNDVLENDSPAHLEWVWPIEQVIGRKQQYRVEFELESA